ncbi:hypothetical protein F5Y19DRAFT_421479 [Xylariaceae sp. FL1651]|nr:hypothetical protein F5Y19DRAFT_421479 [Xylariaceae sp. FL1651]
MKSTRYSVSRQRVCRECSISKTKCDQIESGCSRCVRRALVCTYRSADSPRQNTQRSATSNGAERSSNFTAAINPVLDYAVLGPGNPVGGDSRERRIDSTQPVVDRSAAAVPSVSNSNPCLSTNPRPVTAQIFNESGGLDFTTLELACPIKVEDISNRWLNAYIPLPEQIAKEYPASIKTFLHRIVKSYVAATVRGRGYPPFVHSSQVEAHLIKPPLSTCLSLVRICENLLPGSEGVAVDVLQREMNSLHAHHQTYDTVTLLCAFQAYLIFTMVLFFRLRQISSPYLRQAVMNLQELACSSAKRGLVCEAEQQWHRPRWESWIIAEANRRTLYTMYLFDGILSAHDGLPTFVGTELKGLPAPASQALWRAQTRLDWEASYNKHISEWTLEGLRIDELWRVPEDFDEIETIARRERVDHWLEGVDEFGTMLYAVTSCTHGG